MNDNRYARQILIFGEEGQKKIKDTRVGIVGLGGIGSAIAQGLAYLGVESFVIVDDDYVDDTNLNRLIGGVPDDAETEELKTTVAERTILQINPIATVQSIPHNLRSQAALEALIACPVIFGCVDQDGPRLILMELTAAYEATLIDSATEVFIQDGQVAGFGGRVVVARPGDFCLDCAQQIDKEAAKYQLETLAVQKLREAHGYGLGEEIKAPSVVSINGVIANLALTEFLVMITGLREPNRHLHYQGFPGKVTIRIDKRRADCYTCGYLVGLRDKANIFRYVGSANND